MGCVEEFKTYTSHIGLCVVTLMELRILLRKNGECHGRNVKWRFFRVLEECRLMDVGYCKTWFTWERQNLPETNIMERFDRGWRMQIG